VFLGLACGELLVISGGNDLLRTDKERIVTELAADLRAADTPIVAD